MNQIEKDFILRVLIDRTMTLDYVLNVLGLSYYQHRKELQTDSDYKSKFYSVIEDRSVLSDSEIKNVIDKYRTGLDLIVVYKELGIPYSKHKSTIVKKTKYSKLLEDSRKYRDRIDQLLLLKEINPTRGLSEVLNELDISQYRFKRWLLDPNFKYELSCNKSINIGSFVGENLKKKDWMIIKKSKISSSNFLKYQGKIIGRICDYCNQGKPLTSYHHNTKENPPYQTTCIRCTCIKKNKPFPNEMGEIINGIPRKKRNEDNNLTERRCNKCERMRPTKFFLYEHKKINVCKDCFDDSIPFHPLRSGEYNKHGEIIREYNNLNYVVKKKCNGDCNKMLDLSSFTKNKYNVIDGKSYLCRTCQKIERERQYHRSQSPRRNIT
jgi:hypothetical protein